MERFSRLIRPFLILAAFQACEPQDDKDCQAACDEIVDEADSFELANLDPAAEPWDYETTCFAMVTGDPVVGEWCQLMDDYFACVESCSSS